MEGAPEVDSPNTLKLEYQRPKWPYPPSPQHNSSVVIEVQAGTVMEVALLQSDASPDEVLTGAGTDGLGWSQSLVLAER